MEQTRIHHRYLHLLGILQRSCSFHLYWNLCILHIDLHHPLQCSQDLRRWLYERCRYLYSKQRSSLRAIFQIQGHPTFSSRPYMVLRCLLDSCRAPCRHCALQLGIIKRQYCSFKLFLLGFPRVVYQCNNHYFPTQSNTCPHLHHLHH